MKREEIKAIFADATDEQLKAILDLNGADIEKQKTKITTLETELSKKKSELESLTNDFNALKENNATADEWKSKFETLQTEIAEKERKAEEDRKAQEKADGIKSRFDTVIGEREFTHEAVRADYLRKFSEALDSENYQGKSDTDIIHALTKDDASAFKGVTAFHLEGGANNNFGGASSDLGKLDMAEYIAARNNMKG